MKEQKRRKRKEKLDSSGVARERDELESSKTTLQRRRGLTSGNFSSVSAIKSGSGYPANDARTTTEPARRPALDEEPGATDRSDDTDDADADADEEETARGAAAVARNAELGVERTRCAEEALVSISTSKTKRKTRG